MKITDLVEMNEVKLNMARITWNSLRGNLHEWTPEVANAQPHGKLYEIKYFLSRLPYTMKTVNFAHATNVVEQFGYVSAPIKDEVTKDHFVGSYSIGECALDNPDVYLADGNLDAFSLELYPYTFVTNWVTQKQNKELSNLKGKVLTEEKYTKANIQLVINGNIVENPKLPQTFTDWENRKYFSNNVFQRAA